MHPVVVFTYFAVLGLLCMLLFHPLYLAATLVILILQVVLHGAWREFRQWLPAYVLIGITIIIWNPLFSHRGDTILFYIGGTPIVLESVIYGMTMMLLILSILILFINYNALMGSLKFLYLFSRMLPKSAMMTAMVIRFVPLLRKRLSAIAAIQRTRGISIRYGSLAARLKNGIRLLQAALVWSLEEAMHTADSLTARGYGSGPRSSYGRYRIDRRDKWILITIAVLFLLCLTGWFHGYGSMRIYPSLDDRLMENHMEWLQYVCFLVYLSVPLAVQGREQLLWR